MTTTTGLQAAGEVLIERLKLVSSQNVIIDLTEFMVEIDLYEDMFLNYLHGTIVLTDSRNLIDTLPIIGEEYLMLDAVGRGRLLGFVLGVRLYDDVDRWSHGGAEI